jgi:uncharacterized Zn-binding protein involved in type VI secretion
MGKAVQRKGDKNDKGGSIIQGVDSVLVNGKPIAVTNMPVAPHAPNQNPHLSAKTKNTQSSVMAGGKPVVITGDTDTCGDKRVGGSGDVSIG